MAHSAESFSPSLLPKKVISKLYKTLLVRVLDGRETWSRETWSFILTLRRLMPFIYMEHPFLMFLDHTQRRSTVGRTPLDE